MHVMRHCKAKTSQLITLRQLRSTKFSLEISTIGQARNTDCCNHVNCETYCNSDPHFVTVLFTSRTCCDQADYRSSIIAINSFCRPTILIVVSQTQMQIIAMEKQTKTRDCIYAFMILVSFSCWQEIIACFKENKNLIT